MLPQDLKDYRAAERDPFQLINPDAAVIAVCVLGVIAAIIWSHPIAQVCR